MGYTTVAVAPMVTQTRCGEDVRFLSLNAQRSTCNGSGQTGITCAAAIADGIGPAWRDVSLGIVLPT